eukprot:2955533-Prymnesium_polylepis.1
MRDDPAGAMWMCRVLVSKCPSCENIFVTALPLLLTALLVSSRSARLVPTYFVLLVHAWKIRFACGKDRTVV